METTNPYTFSDFLQNLLIFMGIALALAVLVGLWVWRTVQKLRLPPGLSFIETLRLTPFSVVLLLDLLDFGLDFFSAPISWIILNHLGLVKLRAATAIEALIPGTQFLPTMTTAWVLVRFFGPQLADIPGLGDALERGAEREVQGRPRRLQDIQKGYRDQKG